MKTIVGLKQQHYTQHPNTHMCRRVSSQSPQSSDLPERLLFPYPESMLTPWQGISMSFSVSLVKLIQLHPEIRDNVHPEIRFPQIKGGQQGVKIKANLDEGCVKLLIIKFRVDCTEEVVRWVSKSWARESSSCKVLQHPWT